MHALSIALAFSSFSKFSFVCPSRFISLSWLGPQNIIFRSSYLFVPIVFAAIVSARSNFTSLLIIRSSTFAIVVGRCFVNISLLRFFVVF